ncbi:unnamed protein product [Victoria cruziana]
MRRSGKETVREAAVEKGLRMIMTRAMAKGCNSGVTRTGQRSRMIRAVARDFSSAGQGLIENNSSRRRLNLTPVKGKGEASREQPSHKNKNTATEVAEVGQTISNHTASKVSPKEKQPKFLCNVCLERKSLDRSFRPDHCPHLFCCDCVAVHIATKISENLCTIRCMESGCTSVIELKSCLSILTADVVDRWAALLSESLIHPADKFYCPFKDCSALLWNDTAEKRTIKEAECPHCHRLFCARCRVGWHAGLDCQQYQMKASREKSDDAVLKDLANKKKWRTCPRCHVYVEKISGCQQITCRCGFNFCYNCGSTWSPPHYQCGVLW